MLRGKRLSGIAVVLAIVALASTAWVVNAQDPIKVAPGNHKLIFENDKVRLYEYTAKPGEKVAMHSHPAHVAYFMNDGKVKFTMADGKTIEYEGKAGIARWSDPVTHSIENIGKTEVHVLVFELKGEGAAKGGAK